MAWGADLLSGALNSNVGQQLVDAGAQAATAKIWDATGFGGQEVGSPTAKVSAPASAPMQAAAEPKAKPKKKVWLWVAGGTLFVGGLLYAAKRKGGK